MLPKNQWCTYLQTYIIYILRRCCKKYRTYLHCILRRCCKKYQCSTKGAAKEPVLLHTYILTSAARLKRCCKRIRVSPKCCKSTDRRTAKCNVLHGFLMYHQRCCKRYQCSTKAAAKKQWSGATSLHTYILRHYILTQMLQENQCITKGAAKSTSVAV